MPDNIKTYITEHLEIVLRSFDHISTTTHCIFYGTKTRLTLKLTLMPKKQRSRKNSKFRMRLSWHLLTKLTTPAFGCLFIIHIPLISKNALVILVNYSTYLCKAPVFDLAFIKTKFRNCINVCNDIRFARSKMEPKIKDLLRRVQERTSN